jgi:hypothetical protein
MNDYKEALHLPFSSSRREICIPADHDTVVAPSFNYSSGRIFNLTNGFLTWYFIPPLNSRESSNVISLDLIPVKRMKLLTEGFKLGKSSEFSTGNAVDLMFQASLIPNIAFREHLSSFSLIVCTENAVIFSISFERDEPLAVGYKGTISSSTNLTSPPRLFTLLQDNIAIIVDDKSMINTYRLLPAANIKPEITLNAGSSKIVSFLKGVVGRAGVPCFPVALGDIDTKIVLVHNNFDVSIWNLSTRSQLGRATLPNIGSELIERAKIKVKCIDEDNLILIVAYNCIGSNNWALATYKLNIKHNVSSL